MFRHNLLLTREKPKHWYNSNAPVTGQLILAKVRDDLKPLEEKWQDMLSNSGDRPPLPRLRRGLYAWKLEQIQHQVAACDFVADGSLEVGRLVTEADFPLIDTANSLIMANLRRLAPPLVSDEVLVISSLITVSSQPVPYLVGQSV